MDDIQPKWKTKELEGTIPGVKVQIIRSGNDALALLRKVRSGYRPSGLEFRLIGIDRAKLGPEQWFGGVWKRIAGTKEDYAWHCPVCGQPIMVDLDAKSKSEKGEQVPAGWSEFAEGLPPMSEEIQVARMKRNLQASGLPKRFEVKWLRKADVPRHCQSALTVGAERDDDQSEGKQCSARLWRPALKSRGETKNKPRVNISQVLKRTKRFFQLYFADEAHMAKSENSGRGDAFAQMVRAAKRTVMLTGTVTNGKSTSIKELLCD